jgi:LysR family transcriptional regulator, nitrogen assimilation regulatory protein
MNLRQLTYFVSVVEARNMTRAAEQLHVAQTALGMQIRQIEEDLGVALLVRHSRGVEPTKAGSFLHSRALAILKLVEETRREVSAYNREDRETVRFGINSALMAITGTELALTVREQFPQIFLSMVEEFSHVLIEMLINQEVDFILCYDVPDLPQFSRIALLQEDFVLITPPSRRNGRAIPFAECLEHSLALPESGSAVRNSIARLARELGLELKIAYEVRSDSVMKSLVSRGVASSIIPYALVIDEVHAGKLDAHPIVTPPVRHTLFLASSRQRSPFRNEAGLTGAVRSSLRGYLEALGPLAEPLWVQTA